MQLSVEIDPTSGKKGAEKPIDYAFKENTDAFAVLPLGAGHH